LTPFRTKSEAIASPQESEVRSQKSEVRGQRSESRSQRAVDQEYGTRLKDRLYSPHSLISGL